MRTSLVFLGLFFCFSSQATNFSAIGPNNEGVDFFLKENPYQAYQKFVEAVSVDSFDPTVHFNMGVIYSANKEGDKAIAEYKMAETLAGDNREIKFKALYNQAVELQAKSDIPGALRAYQMALEIDPESKEIKTNIELLWQQKKEQGGGQGDQQNQGQNNDGQGGSSDQQEEKPGDSGAGDKEEQKKKQQPKPFESKELTPDTVRKVLEELKAQEQRVRSEHYSKGQKERPRDKQW